MLHRRRRRRVAAARRRRRRRDDRAPARRRRRIILFRAARRRRRRERRGDRGGGAGDAAAWRRRAATTRGERPPLARRRRARRRPASASSRRAGVLARTENDAGDDARGVLRDVANAATGRRMSGRDDAASAADAVAGVVDVCIIFPARRQIKKSAPRRQRSPSRARLQTRPRARLQRRIFRSRPIVRGPKRERDAGAREGVRCASASGRRRRGSVQTQVK